MGPILETHFGSQQLRKYLPRQIMSLPRSFPCRGIFFAEVKNAKFRGVGTDRLLSQENEHQFKNNPLFMERCLLYLMKTCWQTVTNFIFQNQNESMMRLKISIWNSNFENCMNFHWIYKTAGRLKTNQFYLRCFAIALTCKPVTKEYQKLWQTIDHNCRIYTSHVFCDWFTIGS